MFNFTPETAEEIAVKAGDIVIATTAPSDGWYVLFFMYLLSFDLSSFDSVFTLFNNDNNNNDHRVRVYLESNASVNGFIPMSYVQPAPAFVPPPAPSPPPTFTPQTNNPFGIQQPMQQQQPAPLWSQSSQTSFPMQQQQQQWAQPSPFVSQPSAHSLGSYASSQLSGVSASSTNSLNPIIPASAMTASNPFAAAPQPVTAAPIAPPPVRAPPTIQQKQLSMQRTPAPVAQPSVPAPLPNRAPPKVQQPASKSTPMVDREKQNFGQTLEYWRERERRFMKGEQQKLPENVGRSYYYWDTTTGKRMGPFTDAEMKAKFASRQFTPTTMIELTTSLDMAQSLPARPIQEYFPNVEVAFETAPIPVGAPMMWTYVDDSGLIQGPFSSEQMRNWFQDGYFNEETLARLADKPHMQFVPLGILFPEGVGAFLSQGDQEAATRYVPVQQQQPNPFATQPPSMLQAQSSQRLSYVPANNQNQMYGVPGYGMQQQQQQMPFDFGDLSILDSQDSQGTAGRALLFSALSDPNSQLNQQKPPSATPAFNDVPKAIDASDDWGISWDDEKEESGDAQKMQHSISREESAIPLPVPSEDDSKAGAEKDASKPKVAKLAEVEALFGSDAERLYKFLTRPLPKELGTIHCTIRRSLVGMHMNYNVYELYLETDDGKIGPQLLVANKHKTFTMDSYFNLSIGTINSREMGSTISSLIVNTMGTNWVLHNEVKAHRGPPKDLCVISYISNIGKGPRKMQVALPAFKDEAKGQLVEWPHGGSTKKSSMLKALNALDFADLQPLINKPPTWSKKHNAWTLNFHGRVTRPSVKNFQLCKPSDHDHIVLQHGRVGADTFTMDMAYPCSPIAAFAICISSLHAKLAVE